MADIDLGGASDAVGLALLVTVELCGAQWTEASVSIALRDLAKYPEPLVIAALERCRTELKFKLTLGDIIERIDDGRPAPDEAWAQVSAGLDERATVVATDEALEALGEVRGLAGDHNAVRMAFREAYKRITLRNKASGRFPQWVPSLGHDPEGREVALRAAAAAGRIEASAVVGLLGAATPSLALPPRSEEDMMQEGRERITAIMAQLGDGLRADRQRQRDREPKYDWRQQEERLQREYEPAQRQRTEAA